MERANNQIDIRSLQAAIQELNNTIGLPKKLPNLIASTQYLNEKYFDLETESILRMAFGDNVVVGDLRATLYRGYKDKPDELRSALQFGIDSKQIEKLNLKANIAETNKTEEKTKPNTANAMETKQDKTDKYFDKDIESMLKTAFEDGTITIEVRALLFKQYQDKPNELRSLLTSMAASRLRYLLSLTYPQLDKLGLVEELMQRDVMGFLRLFKAYFGVDYKGKLNID